MFISDELYEQIVHHSVIATVDLIILNQEYQILLGKRTNQPLKGQYYLPGGRIHKDETMIQAAYRKALQETGIEIDISRLVFVGVYDDMFVDSEFGVAATHCLPVTYLYHLSSDEQDTIRLDHQHEDMKFVSIDDSVIESYLRTRLHMIQEIYSIW